MNTPTYQAYINSTSMQAHHLNAHRTGSQLLQQWAAASGLFIGVPMLKATADGITLTVPYYPSPTVTPTGITESALSLNANAIQALGDQLSLAYGVSVSVHLLRLTEPYLDAQVLSAYLSHCLSNSTFKSTMRTLFQGLKLLGNGTTVSLPAWLAGVKVRVAGRLVQERSRPRTTVSQTALGTFQLGRHSVVQAGSYTQANAKGSVTVKVWLCIRD